MCGRVTGGEIRRVLAQDRHHSFSRRGEVLLPAYARHTRLDRDTGVMRLHVKKEVCDI